jgi:hypothetical protein
MKYAIGQMVRARGLTGWVINRTWPSWANAPFYLVSTSEGEQRWHPESDLRADIVAKPTSPRYTV